MLEYRDMRLDDEHGIQAQYAEENAWVCSEFRHEEDFGQTWQGATIVHKLPILHILGKLSSNKVFQVQETQDCLP